MRLGAEAAIGVDESLVSYTFTRCLGRLVRQWVGWRGWAGRQGLNGSRNKIIIKRPHLHCLARPGGQVQGELHRTWPPITLLQSENNSQ